MGYGSSKKVKIFIWRAAQNLLPTVGNLWRRRVVKYHFCQRCNCRGEDVFHALIECKAAKRVWKLTEFYEDVKQIARQDMLSVLQDLTVKRKKNEMELIVAVCWAI